jgi:hypothetical protein
MTEGIEPGRNQKNRLAAVDIFHAIQNVDQPS